MSGNLWELANDLVDLKDLVAQAIWEATEIYDDTCSRDPDEGRSMGDGWPAMGVLVDRPDAIRKLLDELPGPEIADAVRAEREELDHLSDMADGQSY